MGEARAAAGVGVSHLGTERGLALERLAREDLVARLHVEVELRLGELGKLAHHLARVRQQVREAELDEQREQRACLDVDGQPVAHLGMLHLEHRVHLDECAARSLGHAQRCPVHLRDRRRAASAEAGVLGLGC